jgi:hypothetical protein
VRKKVNRKRAVSKKESPLITAAKNNLAQFEEMGKEMQNLMESVGDSNCIWLEPGGTWFDNSGDGFDDDMIYRLRPDFEGDAEQVTLFGGLVSAIVEHVDDNGDCDSQRRGTVSETIRDFLDSHNAKIKVVGK